MTPDPIRRDPRRGGGVERYHTWPTLQRQQVDGHSWNVVRILVAIWPDAPREAILFAQFHDVGEVGTGDAPYPVKHDNPVLRAEMNRLEADTCNTMGLLHHLTVDDHWKTRVKLCDVIEMWEFGMDETALGSAFGRAIVERMSDSIEEIAREHLDEEEIVRLVRYRGWRWTMQP